MLAVIVLPMVFDTEPGQGVAPVSVRIPSEDSPFSPAVQPKPAPAPAVEAAKSPAQAAKPAPAAKPAAKPPAAAEPHAAVERNAAAEAERERAEAALADVEYVVPVAALSSRDKVKELTQRLAAAKLPYYTESIATAGGQVTRVRVGPFANREAADKAVQKLKSLGLKPGNVTTKSG
ncbi:MAG TPA: SPOR domain-containing protein [Burkholderiales bacterium]|nr:SPOR domain-containing protein [Burkholderiales bacterium]